MIHEKQGDKKETSLEKFETEDAALHLLFDNVLNSTDSAAPSSAARSGAAPSGSAPPGSAPSSSAPSGSAAAEPAQLSDLDLIALARSRRPAFMETTAASGSKPKPKKAQAKAKAVVKPKAKAAQKKRPAAVAPDGAPEYI